MNKHPEVMECYLMTGDADYLIRVVVPDVPALERFILDFLTKVPGVGNIPGVGGLIPGQGGGQTGGQQRSPIPIPLPIPNIFGR